MTLSEGHTDTWSRPPDLDGEAKANYRLRHWVGLGGLALVVAILVTIFATPNTPASTASPARVALFVRDHRGGLYLNAYLTSLTVLIGTAFLWYLREVVAPAAPGRRLANLGFAGGLLFLVAGIYAAGVSFAMADVAHHADPNVLQTLNIFSEDINGFGGAATALMMGATSLAILRSKALPSWLAYVGLVLAVASFAIPFLGLLGVGLWVVLTTIVILVTSRAPKVTGQLGLSV
jgi:hypothetical protein